MDQMLRSDDSLIIYMGTDGGKLFDIFLKGSSVYSTIQSFWLSSSSEVSFL